MHKETAVLGFLDISGQHSDIVCTLVCCFLGFGFVLFGWRDGMGHREVQFKKFSLKSSLEATECLNKDQLN